MRMNCRKAGLARQASSSQNRPLTATSMMVSGVSLLVARCSTCVTPSTARSTAARWSIEPVMTSRRGPGSSTRLWHSALTVNPARRSSPEASSLPMNACPTFPVAPVTRIRCELVTSQIMSAGPSIRLADSRSVHPLGLHLGGRVDADEPGRAWPAVGEAVRGAGRADDDVPGAAFEALVADPDQDAALQDDEGLVVGVVMQAGPLAGPVVHEEERHRARAVLAAFEGAGNVIARQVTGVHVVHGSRCLLVADAGGSHRCPGWVRARGAAVTCHRTTGRRHCRDGPVPCPGTGTGASGIPARPGPGTRPRAAPA